jgi:hypothetical protein
VERLLEATAGIPNSGFGPNGVPPTPPHVPEALIFCAF